MSEQHKSYHGIEITVEKRDYDKEARQASRKCNLDTAFCKTLLLSGWVLTVDEIGSYWEYAG